jgi:hypothetical protein
MHRVVSCRVFHPYTQEEKEREAKMRIRRHRYIILSPELAPNGRYARGADPKYAAEDAANPILVDARYSDGAHFRAGASVVHVNWCVGLDSKMNHLKDYGLWFLDGEETRRLVNDLARQPPTTTTATTMAAAVDAMAAVDATTAAAVDATTAVAATVAAVVTATTTEAAVMTAAVDATAATATATVDATTPVASMGAAAAEQQEEPTVEERTGEERTGEERLESLLLLPALKDEDIASGALGLESDPLIAWRKTAWRQSVSTRIDRNAVTNADGDWAHQPGSEESTQFSVGAYSC